MGVKLAERQVDPLEPGNRKPVHPLSNKSKEEGKDDSSVPTGAVKADGRRRTFGVRSRRKTSFETMPSASLVDSL